MMSKGTHPVDFEDFSNPCNEQQSQEVLVTPLASSTRPNHKRSKNFSEKEDEIFVSTWLNVSLDPITGANQTHKSYWTRIHDYFYENLPFSLDHTIAGRRQSGATMHDMVLTSYIEDAKAMYKSKDGQKRSFQFMDCWKQLRGQAKWMAKLDELAGKSSNKKQKKTSNLSLATPSLTTADGHEVAALEENTLSRPMGHKKKNERFKQAFALEQERLELRAQKVELKNKKDEERIMTMDLSAMPYDQQQ
ncbi:uncharacterized protein [Miscanthus floridulus]|uniref:uncharacterized protein n=1 Tax=Miscanthus floridulus TaxID=154761 RepID=UPI0034579EE3